MTASTDVLASRDEMSRVRDRIDSSLALAKHPCDAMVFALQMIVQRCTARHGMNAGKLKLTQHRRGTP
jgi:hypothetical protein